MRFSIELTGPAIVKRAAAGAEILTVPFDEVYTDLPGSEYSTRKIEDAIEISCALLKHVKFVKTGRERIQVLLLQSTGPSHRQFRRIGIAWTDGMTAEQNVFFKDLLNLPPSTIRIF